MSQIVEREREFYNQHWQTTKIQKVRKVLKIPGVKSLVGRKVLICSCGSGTEPMQAVNAGAEVFTFDISPVAVAKALELAEVNNAKIVAQEMDFHSLLYPDNCFDFIYGTSILHHIDCNLAGKEIYRCLKPGGIAFFWENSDRNPILRGARRAMFGSPGGYQKRRALFFTREGTTDEYPLTEAEVGILSEIFSGKLERIYQEFVFFYLLSEFGWKKPSFARMMATCDRLAVNLFPFIMKYSFIQGIKLEKKSSGA